MHINPTVRALVDTYVENLHGFGSSYPDPEVPAAWRAQNLEELAKYHGDACSLYVFKAFDALGFDYPRDEFITVFCETVIQQAMHLSKGPKVGNFACGDYVLVNDDTAEGTLGIVDNCAAEKVHVRATNDTGKKGIGWFDPHELAKLTKA